MGTESAAGKRAVFLDRDGVINRNIWNAATGSFEAPLKEEAFQLLPGVLDALKDLQNAGYLLFVVSNQPNYAKGKAAVDEPAAIHRRLLALATEAGILFAGCYYCFHHPEGSETAYAGTCLCRKPSPYFLLQARDYFGVDLEQSWMVGDRDSDVRCGKAAGARTILIREECLALTPDGSGPAHADLSAPNLPRAVQQILDASAFNPQPR